MEQKPIELEKNETTISSRPTTPVAVGIVRETAIKIHAAHGSLYAGYPYSLHLDSVHHILVNSHPFFHSFSFYTSKREPLDNDRFASMIRAAYCHDLMEDCGLSYKDVLKLTDDRLCTDIVYNLTNEKGRNRAEKHERTYPDIARCELSTFIKLCDRLANVSFSRANNAHMFELYRAEYKKFKDKLCVWESLEFMWIELERLHKPLFSIEV